MVLKEYLAGAVPSDMIIIKDSTGEIYRGYIGCLEYAQIDTGREVRRHKLVTDIFRKEKYKERYIRQQKLGEKMGMESISSFSFADLQMLVYTQLELEG